MCKVNDAGCVKLMMSSDGRRHRRSSRLITGINQVFTYKCRHNELDNALWLGVIVFTLLEPFRPTYNDGRQNTRNQAESSSTSRHAQSSARSGHSPVVSDERFLRCRRYDPGQVRDAPPGAGRAAADNRVRKSIWFLTAVVLSGTTGVRAERIVGIDTAETWPSQRTQADGRGDGVSQPSSRQRLIPENRRLGANRGREVRCGGAPPQHRTSTLTTKKTPVSLIPSAASADQLVSRYEELRRQVLDRYSGIYRGPGLALLLQRGMRAWMEVSSIYPTTPSSTTPRPSTREPVLASEQRGEMVMILASMALHRYPEANG
jgi:hypothetical protein